MRGSVVKKGDRWYVKIELDPEPGSARRRQKWHSGYRTKREAERARVDLLSKLDRGEYVEPAHQTLGDFLVDWLAGITPTVLASPFASYSRQVRIHITHTTDPLRPTQLDAGCRTALPAPPPPSGRGPSRGPAGVGASGWRAPPVLSPRSFRAPSAHAS